MNCVLYEKAPCVCHYTEANVWCNLQVDTVEFMSDHVEDKILYLNQLAYFYLKKNLLLQLPLDFMLHPGDMT